MKGKLPHLSSHEFAQMSGLTEAEVRGMRERFGIDASVLSSSSTVKPLPNLREAAPKPSAMEQLEAERDRWRRQYEEQQRVSKHLVEDNQKLTRDLRSREADVQTLRFELAMERRRTPASSPLDPSQVSDLIRLCHPDRHQPGLAPLANRITAWLLTLRRT